MQTIQTDYKCSLNYFNGETTTITGKKNRKNLTDIMYLLSVPYPFV